MLPWQIHSLLAINRRFCREMARHVFFWQRIQIPSLGHSWMHINIMVEPLHRYYSKCVTYLPLVTHIFVSDFCTDKKRLPKYISVGVK